MSKRKVAIRTWNKGDIPAILQCQRAAYSEMSEEELCHERHYLLQLKTFPQGQFLAEVDGKVVGYATSFIVQLEEKIENYTYAELTGVGTFSAHNPAGDTLYGADIAIIPEYRGMGIAGMLYNKRKALMKRLNLKRLVAGGRIPGYKQYAGVIAPERYVEMVKRGEIDDPALKAHLKAGYRVTGIHIDYFSDEASLNYATALEMRNPDFDPSKRPLSAIPVQKMTRRVRICTTQFEMKSLSSWEDFVAHVHFFVETAYEYGCHFLVFPELFTAQLFSIMDKKLSTEQSIEELSRSYTKLYIDLFLDMAKKYNLYIIGGSHPIFTNEKIYNRAHFFTPKGNLYSQDKLHVTPGERRVWNITPGEKIVIFNTEMVRFAIPICYDIEFPELCRLMTLYGAEVLFVPFATDEINSYYRIRHCAQARAVENMVYVVLSGNIGNLIGVKSFLINYGQAAVCTPCDVSFPKKGIAAEADPNAETVIIYDLDLTSLSLQRSQGSVLPLKDRRLDLYGCIPLTPVEIIQVE